MLKCVICNRAGWSLGEVIRPNCTLCMLKRKRPLSEVSIEVFNKLLQLNDTVLEDINVDAHARFRAFREYGLLSEWSSERIFGEYLEAAKVLERSAGHVPINIPLTINESDYYKLDFSHYKTPKEESSSGHNPGHFGRGRPSASSPPQRAALERKVS